ISERRPGTFTRARTAANRGRGLPSAYRRSRSMVRTAPSWASSRYSVGNSRRGTSRNLHPLVDPMAAGVIDRERSGAGHHEGERPDQDEQRILVTADDRASRGRIDDRAVQEKTLWPAEQEQAARRDRHLTERRPRGEKADGEQRATDQMRGDRVPGEEGGDTGRIADAHHQVGQVTGTDDRPRVPAVHDEDHA